MNEFTDPFKAQIEQMAQEAEQADAALLSAEEKTVDWEKSREHINHTVIATLTYWLAAIKRQMQPIHLRTLYWNRLKVAAYRGITRRHPAGVRERLRNWWLRLQIGIRWFWIYKRIIFIVIFVILLIIAGIWLAINWPEIPGMIRDFWRSGFRIGG